MRDTVYIYTAVIVKDVGLKVADTILYVNAS